MTMECTRCGARKDHAIPGDPSYEIPCPDRRCSGRLTGYLTTK